jgi:hypothetical protein
MHLHDAQWTLAATSGSDVDDPAALERCPGCGGRHPSSDIAPHAYLTPSSGCWAHFCELLAWQYSDHRYWRAHDLMVDAYCLQHSGGADARATRATPVHLAALHAQVSLHLPQAQIALLRARLTRHGMAEPLEPRPAPRAGFDCGIENPSNHLASIRAYAQSVWSDWHAHFELAEYLFRQAMADAR